MEYQEPYVMQIMLSSALIVIGTYLVVTNLKEAVKYDYRLWIRNGQGNCN